MNHNPAETCENCLSFDRYDGKTKLGHCCHQPPFRLDGFSSTFPRVGLMNWCRQWERAEPIERTTPKK